MAIQPWTITQIGGDQKTLTLVGSYAPHGRPRKGPVVTDTIELRRTKTVYPGNSEPTVHTSNVSYEPWEIHGRFRDSMFGSAGAANRMVRFIQQMVRDEQVVRVRWGDILSYRALLSKFTPNREAAHEIEWRLELDILADEDAEAIIPVTPVRTPSQMTAEMDRLLQNYTATIPRNGIPGVSLNPEFLDQIDNLVSAINAPMAELRSLSEQVESFGDALVGDLRRMRASSANLSAAVQNMRDAVEMFGDDNVVLFGSSDASTSWAVTRTTSEADAADILALLAEFEREAEIAERGQTTTSVQAEEGDSWESMSVRAYGAPDQAQKLRDANGARYGERPVPGRAYTVPVGT